MCDEMSEEVTERPQRSDAQRNHRRVLEAAAEVFAEQGLEAGVGEIAARAGVGRGTLFRHFASKDALIAAILIDRIQEMVEEGRRLLESGDGAEMAFAFIGEMVARQQENRALVDGVDEAFLAQAEVADAYRVLIELLGQMIERGQAAGSVRAEVSAVDAMMLIKGVCAAASALELSPALLERHVSLIRAAISSPSHAVPLGGPAPTLADLEPRTGFEAASGG